jgi:hypothetical protein
MCPEAFFTSGTWLSSEALEAKEENLFVWFAQIPENQDISAQMLSKHE